MAQLITIQESTLRNYLKAFWSVSGIPQRNKARFYITSRQTDTPEQVVQAMALRCTRAAALPQSLEMLIADLIS